MENQKGIAPVLLLILAAAGIIIYLLVSSTFPFKDKLFGSLYPKPPSHAQEAWSSLEPYGINDWNFTDSALTAAKAAGITWVRLQGVLWKNIEPVQGQFNWNSGPVSRVDDYVAQATKYGMKITAPVSLAPDWAKQPGLDLPQPDLYANFLKTLLNRYPGKIAAIEVLAEENTGSWPDTKNRDAAYYAPILKAAYQAVKSVDPNVLVVTSSMWGSPVGYLEDLYNLGDKGYFDVANFHYYPGNISPSQNYDWLISHYRKVMEKYGDGGKPIWMTEFAWPIDDEPEGRRVADLVSPQQQSDYLTYVLQNSMKSGFIQKIFWYTLTGDDGMSMIHTTNNYNWRILQPTLTASIGPTDTSLTVSNTTKDTSGAAQTVNWTTAWPQTGTLLIDSEQIKYTSLSASADGSSTIVSGLTRAANNTSAAAHAAGTTAQSQDQTSSFIRQIYSTYKNFIQGNSTWSASQVAALPDVPPAASAALLISNSGFESGTSDWSGSFTIDSSQYHSGNASAKLVNTTGTGVRASHKVIPVESGKSYLLKAWVKIDPGGSGNMSTMVTANLRDSSGTYISNVPGNYYIYTTSGNWREIHYPIRTPGNASQLVIYLSTDKGTGTAWFDDITVEPYSLVPSFLLPSPTPTPTPTPMTDTTAPTVAITSPSSGNVATHSTISISATASDNIGVTKVEFYANGSALCTDAQSPYSCNWRVPGKKGASYTLTTKAYDKAGNVGTSAPVNVVAQ